MVNKDMETSPVEDAITRQVVATMQGETEAAKQLLAQGQGGIRAMLRTRSRGPYPNDLHVIDAARRLTEVLHEVVQHEPELLFQLAHDAGAELLDAECSDLLRLLQEVRPGDEDSAVDIALSVMEHENPYVRYHGVRILLKFPRERARSALQERLRDRSLMVRRRVIHGMTANGFFRTPEVRAELDKLLASGTPLQRNSLLWAEMKTLQQLIQTERPAALS